MAVTPVVEGAGGVPACICHVRSPDGMGRPRMEEHLLFLREDRDARELHLRVRRIIAFERYRHRGRPRERRGRVRRLLESSARNGMR